jgi:hypothetical protein
MLELIIFAIVDKVKEPLEALTLPLAMLSIVAVVNRVEPLTCSKKAGEVVLIPIFPLDVNRLDVVPFRILS